MGNSLSKQKRDEQSIRWVYHWIFWSAPITVIWMSINLISLSFSSRASLSDWLWSVTTPLFAHVILLAGFGQNKLFKKRHHQQALLLVTARWLSALFTLGFTRGNAVGLWFLLNTSLWLFGTLIGLSQVSRGDCWLMRRRGEGNQLPRPWALPHPELESPHSPLNENDFGTALVEGRQFLEKNKPSSAIEKFRIAFRSRDPKLRKEALEELDKLNQVGSF